MGYGEYSHAAHVAITSARTPQTAPFTGAGPHPLMQPAGVRECRDSDDHPDSLPIAFALDVTGSMGDIPRVLATSTLPDFMRVLVDAQIRDPQLCFLAVGHADQDRAPLQVGQFESTAALIDLWLQRLWLEGGGVGQHEAYELAMYFAARRMKLDSVDKRGRRGLLFLTGDAPPNPAVSRVQVARLLGEHLPDDLPIRALIDELQRTFEPFFLLADNAPARVERAWRDLLGDRVVRLGHADDAAYVAAGLIALLHGSARSLRAYVDGLARAGMGRAQTTRVATALVPFAASVRRDGAPDPSWRDLHLPTGDRASGLVR